MTESRIWKSLVSAINSNGPTFAVAGKLALPVVRVGTGDNTALLRYPVTGEDLEDLKTRGIVARSMYGDVKKEATVLDTDVRDSYECPFEVVNAEAFGKELAKAADMVMGQMLVGGRGISVEPYRAVLYPTGGHFAPHVDTHKEGAHNEARQHFGTMSIALPAVGEGGRLTVTSSFQLIGDEDKAPVLEMPSDGYPDEMTAPFLAWFNACPHEVPKVTSGVQASLVFNIYAQPAPLDPFVASKALAQASPWLFKKESTELDKSERLVAEALESFFDEMDATLARPELKDKTHVALLLQQPKSFFSFDRKEWMIDGVDRVLHDVLQKRYNEIEVIHFDGQIWAALTSSPQELLFKLDSEWLDEKDEKTIFVPPLDEIHKWVDWGCFEQSNDFESMYSEIRASVFRFPKRLQASEPANP